jgi:uncharacterized Zn-finger protein
MNKEKETIIVLDKKVSCVGEEYPYDHPKIYLEIAKDKTEIECPYCSRVFKFFKK